MLTYAAEYFVIFVLLLVASYVVPAGLFHCLFSTLRSPATEAMRIQKRRPSAQDIRREIRQSVSALLLFSAYCLIVYHAARKGATAVYFDFAAHPWWWAVAGFAAMVVLHDIYFYTTHRLMHLPPLFKAVHAGHHRSLTPTPWSILSFQPLETISQFGFFALVIFFVPLHPATLLAYLLFDGIVNAAGHCGHEFVAPASQEHWVLKYVNAVTHHDLHHSRFRYNFGQYFNILDRLFGTFLDRPPA
jgi:sterol desaturase/sphingolipid hydroxylase (fatty acid hydroxylase superfamily)